MARILVIEDNPANLELMVYLIQAFGHTPLSAIDGEVGIDLARRETPELIICDIQLPKIDGYEVLRRLKAYPTLRNVPVVAVTALAMVGDRDKVLAAGFDGYIAKPIAPETFVPQIHSFLSTDQRATAEAQVPAATTTVTTTNTTPPGKSVTLLVVDNSPVNLELARSLFEPSGYQVITANSAEQGLALARRSPPDLIISDVHMPGEDGFIFMQKVKADPELYAIPFVFLSSSMLRSRENETQALAFGAIKFLRRPIAPERLLEEIEECLKRAE